MCSQRVRKVWSSQVPVGWGERENKWSSSWGLVLFLLILVSVLLVSTWIHIRRGHRHSGQRPSRSAAYFLLGVVPVGLGDGVGDCHDVANLPWVSFYFLFYLLWGLNFTLFQGIVFFYIFFTAGYASS